MKNNEWLPCGLLLLVCGSSPAMAQNNVVFLDGGYTELCASLSKPIENAATANITGSRLDRSAIDICTKAIKEEATTPSVLAGNYNNRGVLQFGQGAMAEAVADFEEAVRRQPDLAQAYVNLGYTFVAQERWADSIEPLSRGIELGAIELPKVLYNRGIAYEETGQLNNAYQDYLKAAELAPEWDAPRSELSRFNVR